MSAVGEGNRYSVYHMTTETQKCFAFESEHYDLNCEMLCLDEL
jgi:hypothetical protein